VSEQLPPEVPIQATSYFILNARKRVFQQQIKFSYYDVGTVFWAQQQLGHDEFFRFLDDIQSNMQTFIDEDRIYLNEIEVSLKIQATQVTYKQRKKIYPILTFDLISIGKIILKTGKNQIILDAPQEAVTYPVLSTWKLPGKVLHVLSTTIFKISGDRITFTTNIGQEIGGYEVIEFKF